MKRSILITLSLSALLLSGCWQRIGDLTMMSNRNIESSQKYELLYRNAEGTAKMKKDDALERAIDKITEEHQGEYLMNVKVYVKNNGQVIKIQGDVWGVKQDSTSIQ